MTTPPHVACHTKQNQAHRLAVAVTSCGEEGPWPAPVPVRPRRRGFHAERVEGGFHQTQCESRCMTPSAAPGLLLKPVNLVRGGTRPPVPPPFGDFDPNRRQRRTLASGSVTPERLGRGSQPDDAATELPHRGELVTAPGASPWPGALRRGATRRLRPCRGGKPTAWSTSTRGRDLALRRGPCRCRANTQRKAWRCRRRDQRGGRDRANRTVGSP